MLCAKSALGCYALPKSVRILAVNLQLKQVRGQPSRWFFVDFTVSELCPDSVCMLKIMLGNYSFNDLGFYIISMLQVNYYQ